MNDKLNYLPPNKAIILKNKTCVYCGRSVSEQFTKEHVIGRRFVPKGKLENEWNLIVRACVECNNKKSDLENDISAITMHPDLLGSHVIEDEILNETSKNKSNKAISRATGRIINESHVQFSITHSPIPNFNFKFNIKGQPQISDERIFQLARFQVQAFFYYLTYSEEKYLGRFWEDEFLPINSAHQNDWGNSLQVSFMKKISAWDLAIIGITADEFFKIIIRKLDYEKCWAWAVEWNKNYRVIGFIGCLNQVKSIFNQLDQLVADEIHPSESGVVAIRTEKKLPPDLDVLFCTTINKIKS
jgi:hypothetical protein